MLPKVLSRPLAASAGSGLTLDFRAGTPMRSSGRLPGVVRRRVKQWNPPTETRHPRGGIVSGINLIELLIRVPVLLLALTLHEVCHGYFAYRMGDPTAYLQGRLSLNPLKHLDPLGALCLLFAPIGWAKPVPINPLNFRDRRKGILVSTAAGPVSNLVQAILFALVLRAVLAFTHGLPPAGHPQIVLFVGLLGELCYAAIWINVGLAVFNFLPLFPLDGFHITLQLLPPASQEWFAGMKLYGPFVILGLVLAENAFGVHILSSLIMPPVRFLLYHVAGINE